MKTNGIEKVIFNGFRESSTADLGAEVLEIRIDEILSSETLQAIPIVNTVLAIKSAWNSISDKIFLSKIYKFLFEGHRINKENKASLAAITSTPEDVEKIGSAILLSIDTTILKNLRISQGCSRHS